MNNESFKYNYPVAIDRCENYDIDALTGLIASQWTSLGIAADYFRGRRVMIKPNLVSAKKPDSAATTHPNMLRAAIRALRRFGASEIIVAESSGGPYTQISLRTIYKTCMTDAACVSEDCPLNFDTTAAAVRYDEGKMCRSFNMITPAHNVDVIVNLCKLKTHSLTGISCGVKNLFGLIPGVEKFEMHARYSNMNDFTEMLIDLCLCTMQYHEVLTVCDAVVAMEGNGPTGGNPRIVGAMLSSLSPFSLDIAAEALIGYSGTVPMLDKYAERGICPRMSADLDIIGCSPASFGITDFKTAEAQHASLLLKKLPDLFGGRLARYLSPRPVIDSKKCVGCGRCAESCPVSTIIIKKDGKGKVASISRSKCIRCYCCQELCPINSVKIRKNLILKILR